MFSWQKWLKVHEYELLSWIASSQLDNNQNRDILIMACVVVCSLDPYSCSPNCYKVKIRPGIEGTLCAVFMSKS